MGKYDDIINHEVPTSQNHPRMSMNNRAAQFAPFAALVGYAEAINSSRETSDTKKTISDDKKEEIEGLLHKISSDLSRIWNIEVIYYALDINTKKGKYYKYKGKVKKIDVNSKAIVFISKKTIYLKDIIDITILDEE